MHKTDKKYVFLFIGRLLIGILFFYSGLSKLIRPIEYFEVAVAQYKIIPEDLIHYVCLIVPWVELINGTYLLLGYALNMVGGILIGLTGIFQVVLAQAMIRKLPMDECGCFGGGLIHLTLSQSFFLDTAVMILLAYIATTDNHLFTLDHKLRKQREAA